MAQKTAVEWLIEQILLKHPLITQYLPDYSFDKSIVEQAKQMHKEQTVNAWERGKYIGMSFPQGSIPNEYEQNGTQYYNQTYIEQ